VCKRLFIRLHLLFNDCRGVFFMIIVCKKHVNKGLNMIFLPHVQPISDENKLTGIFKCQICCQQADYKLYNFITQRKQDVKKAI
jgi:predicted nucleotide-binding protein (sugar kinase/HSP70/actin superfamily)